LGDLCRSAGYRPAFAKRVSAIASVPVGEIRTSRASSSPLADSIAFLEKSYRFGRDSGIGTLARLVNEGRAEEALAALTSGRHPDIAWASLTRAQLTSRLGELVGRMRPYFDAIRANEPPQAVLDRLNEFRLLCARRSGPFGVAAVNRTIERLLEAERLVNTRETWYPGRPVMITRNDYNVRLFNGDIGIALQDRDGDGALKVFFRDEKGGIRAIAPGRLPEHETVYAMTIHKTQGSEFARVLIILPTEPSPVMSRELVYTGITRARERVEIWSSELAFRTAVERRLVRASGLQEKLWGGRAV
jgi:exodeoxyribonuclease V alpha subunit